MTKSVGEGGLELLGHSFGLGISVCVLYFSIALLGWIAARYRYKFLGLVVSYLSLHDFTSFLRFF